MWKNIRILQNLRMEFFKRFKQYKIIKNVNASSFDRHCLLVYITHPFIKKTKTEKHQNQWQVIELARIIGKFGYNVDVIDFDNPKVKLDIKYDLIIDMNPGANHSYDDYRKDDSYLIAYLTESNHSFYIEQTKKRFDYQKKRRGCIWEPERLGKPFKRHDLESCDFVFFIGNQRNWNTYNEFLMPPVSFIINNGYEFDLDIDSKEKRSTNFMFFAGGGQVQKGLDLLLEAFSKNNKECKLYICSPFKSEKNFCREYEKELFQTPNIIPVGFVDFHSKEFLSIAEKCSYMILPSCSEGQAGSVLVAMSAGLIPIIRFECGYEDKELFYLQECSVEHISNTIASFSKQEMKWIYQKAALMQFVVKKKYKKEDFSKSVINAMKSFEDHCRKQKPKIKLN